MLLRCARSLTGPCQSTLRYLRTPYADAKRRYATHIRDEANVPSARTRNIGIIAHIDAGKTTTTERMLYYAGYTRRLGDVDEGSTVTDFLPAERARGITIQSAAISFSWPPGANHEAKREASVTMPRSSVPHNFNLIDTPGHADFTFEVLRSLRVLDGAVCILDGVAGVEAQTEKVWTQASAYGIPRIIFVNKLDRDGAAFGQTVKDIGTRLNIWPVVCGIPWWTNEGRLQGVGDVIGLRGLRYVEGGDGKQIQVFGLTQLQDEDAQLAQELRKARVALVEQLSEHDDGMVEKYLEADEDHLQILPMDIISSLRTCVLKHPQSIVPVFAGASFRNVGVQPLLDAVTDLLPCPNERPDPPVSLSSTVKGGLQDFLQGKLSAGIKNPSSGNPKTTSKEKPLVALQKVEACALAFKVVADAKRGVLVYVRVYSGKISRNATLWNTSLQNAERAQRLLKMYANDAVEIESIEAGQIGVIPGLKFARTGDTLVSYAGMNPKTGPPQLISSLQLRPIDVPPPVFFVSVEPSSLAEEKHIRECLDLLLREDPSLHVSVDEESGQTHLAGMGELHLEIARDRLVNDLKAKAQIGKIEIGYREALTTPSSELDVVFDRDINGKHSKAGCTASVRPTDGVPIAPYNDSMHVRELADGNTLFMSFPTLDDSGSSSELDQVSLPEHLPLQTVMQVLQNGVSAALARGPAHGYPVHSTVIAITLDPVKHVFPNTTPAAISSAARMAVQQALRDSTAASEAVMMEPVMLVTLSVDEDSLGSVMHDLSSSRGGSVISLDMEGDTESKEHQVDISKIYAPPDPYLGSQSGASTSMVFGGTAMRQIVARVPLKEMVGYLKHLRSLTAGRGTFTMAVDQFERMSGQRQRVVLNELRGEHI